MSTVHANNPVEAVGRLETLVLMSGTDLPSRAIREQIASAVHIIVQQQRLRGGGRRIVSISEVTGFGEGSGGIGLQELFTFNQVGVSAEGKAIGYHTATGTLPKRLERFQKSGEDLPSALFDPSRRGHRPAFAIGAAAIRDSGSAARPGRDRRQPFLGSARPDADLLLHLPRALLARALSSPRRPLSVLPPAPDGALGVPSRRLPGRLPVSRDRARGQARRGGCGQAPAARRRCVAPGTARAGLCRVHAAHALRSPALRLRGRASSQPPSAEPDPGVALAGLPRARLQALRSDGARPGRRLLAGASTALRGPARARDAGAGTAVRPARADLHRRCTPVLVRLYGEGWRRLARERGWRLPSTPASLPLAAITAGALLALALFVGIAAEGRLRAQEALTRESYPVAASDWLAAHPEVGTRMFNSYGWGGYLVYRFYPTPRRRVFVFGEATLMGDDQLRRYAAVESIAPDWQGQLRSAGVDYIVFNRGAPFANALQVDPEWRLVYQDRVAVIYVRRPGQ